MCKHPYKVGKVFLKVKTKRDSINPDLGFLAQLKLFKSMEFTIDHNNVQYKMFQLFCASEQMRKTLKRPSSLRSAGWKTRSSRT